MRVLLCACSMRTVCGCLSGCGQLSLYRGAFPAVPLLHSCTILVYAAQVLSVLPVHDGPGRTYLYSAFVAVQVQGLW